MSVGEGDPRAQDVETTWNLYLKKEGWAKGRSVKEVFDLAINPEIKSEFQQRAIRTLLDLGMTSFHDRQTVGELEIVPSDFDENLPIIWAQHLDYPQAQYAAEMLPSFLKKTSQGEQMNHFKFPKYLSILLDLLPGLPQEQAEKLFENFDYDFQQAQSLLALFKRDHDYDGWKEKGVEEAHKRIRQNRVGDPYAGVDYRHFLGLASNNVNGTSSLVFPGSGRPNQNRIDFFVKEIVWAMDVYPSQGRIIQSEVDFINIFNSLPEALRHNFIKGHISILSKQGVEKLAEMFPDYIEISAHLEKLRADEEKKRSNVPALLIEGVEFELKNRIKKEQEKAEEERIIASMKKKRPQ